jgi:DeoR/GlpR family transcriptional regulator of sugar metabolism
MNISRIRQQEEIHQFIVAKKVVTVDDLCNKFSSSEATIRRILKDLSDRGLITRKRGGASYIPPTIPEPPVFLRISELPAQKEAIARIAGETVVDGDTVFLGSGSTVLAVAQQLKQRNNLTIISNSLPIINLFSNIPNISVVILGGLLRNSELSMLGYLTEQAIRELRADKVIIGIRAIDPHSGLANDYLPETITDRTIVQMSKKVIVVADHTKFGKIATSFVAPLSSIDTIITDWEVNRDFVRQIEEYGVKVIVASKNS